MKGKVKVVISNEQNEVRIPAGVRMLVRRCCTAVLVQEIIKAYERSNEKNGR